MIARGRVCALVLAIAASGCSTIGSPPGRPEGVPHGGTGPFRLLTPEETDVPPSPAGAAVSERTRGTENGMVAGDHLFYAGAEPLPASDAGVGDAGMDDAGVDDAGVDDAGVDDAGVDDAGASDAGIGDAGPEGPLQVDWSRFEPRRIYRSPPREGSVGFDSGREVLVAEQAWEGGYVSDPWAVVLEDGRTLLYYAAEGGIGVAVAPSIDGTFERAGASPVIAGAVRRPSVIDTRGTIARHPFLMYFEREERIVVAGSIDGLAWDELTTLSLPPLAARDERDSEERAIGGPGAIAARTEAGRSIVRLYYESRRADGQVLIAMAGSFDGLAFDALAVPAGAQRALRWPAPRALDPRISLLYLQGSRGGRNQRGALVAAIAPAGVVLP